MKKFLVTGGAGFLGINLARLLLKKGYLVRSLDIAPFNYVEKNVVEVVTGDIRKKEGVKTAMKDIDVVVHCAAALPLYSKKNIFTTDIDGTENVLSAAETEGVERVIHISSTAVYGIPDHHPLLETDSLSGVGPYGKAKIIAEQLCEKYRNKGMCIPVLRPKSFIGPERLGVFSLLYDWAKDGKRFPMIGSGNNRYQLLDVEDLCEAIYLVATKPCKQVNTVFNIGAAEFGTMREDYQSVLDRAGFGKKVVSLPSAPIIWVLRVLDFLRLSPLYKWVYETASKDSYVSIERAKKILSWSPKYSNKESLLRNFEWYIEHLEDFQKSTGVSHREPWKQGVLAIAKKFF